ncbi:GerAB/ArcD/ProY family transporter [Halalkalibacterium halodurans]|uniref:GerAB/ArcD/ProY family transporter n=1 Tax=Halalkalibacterium halodurans TaxID=86665 RepID=UPI001067EA6F|nr:GerAB/ArcD/ProY family transporter [Halalkalibacterium halodurans]MED3646940.1 GerAB/ArcD/ProY family transporter [Halalkalibacterium halodurans]TES47249.1 spore gernimation protein GerB [Halalkalibacterium halodurans]
MGDIKISPGQLFALIFLFNMGTALVVSLGIMAEKDAWLATLFGTVTGLLLFFVYVALYRQYTNLPLSGYIIEILGKPIGWPLALLYAIFFIYGAVRDVRDGGVLLVISVLDQTPLIVINAVMTLSVAYVLNKGIEVLGRTALIFLGILVLSGVASNLLLFVSGVVDFTRLLPVLERGWGPVLETTLTHTYEFPFNEVICFTMVLPLLSEMKRGIRYGVIATLLSGFVLSLTTAMNIAALGIGIAGRATFPLLHTISLVNIGEFIQRLDLLVVLSLIIGDFFKIALFYYAGVKTAADLFQISDHRKLIYPVGLIILFVSMMIAGNFAEHIEEGNFALISVFLIFGSGLPILMLIVSTVKGKFRSNSS